jgi:para-aminobenzoate synthetase component I
MIPSDTIQQMNALGQQGVPFLFAVNFEGSEAFVLQEHEWKARGIQFAINESNGNRAAPPAWDLQPMPFESYLEAYTIVHKHLLAGNSYLVNLTFPTRLQTDMTLEEVYRLSKARYKLLVPGQFVVFSPESFVRIHEGMIATFPMKGTIDADIPEAASLILQDDKELAEHVTTVDLLRNDLSRVATAVRVNHFRYISHIRTDRKNLLQVSSEISGKLPDNYAAKLGDIFNTLLPAGSICGAPKKKTLEIIREAEQQPRGFYTGVFGYFDGQDLDSAVLIRYIEQTPEGLFFRSGGGITASSDPHREYLELIDKVYIPQ